ncbi:hypothetical protein SRABI118_04958 [Massilia sp. Bi118]|nr:hypothetical protein SRABI118_04958 [Massilia sp. Bi118]
MRPRGRQAEDVGRQLHCAVALRAAAGHAQLGDRHPAPLLDPLLPLAQRVGQAFEDGAVDVGAGVDVAEADDAALRFAPRHADAGRPVRLQHQAHRTGRHAAGHAVEQLLRRDILGQCADLLVVAELLLEPVDHPVAAEHLHLVAVGAGDRCRIRRNEGRHLGVARAGGVDCGGGAVAQAADVRLAAAGPDHLAGFVGGRGQQRQALRDAGVHRSLGRDRAEALSRLGQFGQHVRLDGQGLPLPVVAGGPAPALVVEGQIGHLRAARIRKAAAQAPVQVAGQQQEFVGRLPDLGLVRLDPVDLGLAAEVIDGAVDPRQLERRLPPPGDGRIDAGPALVEPGDGRAQRLAVLAEADHGAALGGHGHALHRRLVHAGLVPQSLAGLAQGSPVILGLVLGPAGLGRIISLQHDLGLGDDIPLQVEQQRAHALGAVVDGEDGRLHAHVVSSCGRP